MRAVTVLLVSACFFLSGAAALIYEVVWLRLLGLTFGHTIHAMTTVLTAYMGGLALGSLALGRRADALRRPLLVYGLLEGLIGVSCLATPLLFAGTDAAYLALHRALTPSAAGALAIQFVLSAVVLIVPTTLMGATLPVLSRAIVERRDAVGLRVGTLYGLNTLGAVVGVLASGFALLPGIGVRATVLVAFTLNVVVAAVAVALARGAATGAPRAPEPAEAPAIAKPAEPRTRRLHAVALAAIAVSGAASMTYELAWTRLLTLLVGSTAYAFSAMLATFLTGLAVGALVVARSRRLQAAALAAFALAECLAGVAAVLLLPVFPRLPALVLWILSTVGISHGGALAVQFALSFLVMIVPTLLVGATLPLVVTGLARGVGSVGTDVGRVYGANTVGTIVGSAVAGFVLVPVLGIRGAIVAAAAANVAAGLAVLLAAPGVGRRLRAAGVAAVAALALVAVVAPPWDPEALAAGVSVYPERYLARKAEGDGARIALDGELRLYVEGISTTVSVSQLGDFRSLTVNGKVDASNGTDMVTQLLLGHLPCLLRPEARRALVIGLGSGVTAGAVAQHPVESIDVAELESAMTDAARLFAAENHGVLDDPRVRVRVGDGRHVLAAGDAPWDLVISEPSNPWIAGVGNLFTREFYEVARAHLAPRGVMVQWLQGYGIYAREMQMVVRTFREVFPHVTVWRSLRAEYLLVGSLEPLELDPAAMRARLDAAPRARADLDRYGIDAENLAYRFLLSRDDARRYSDGAPLNTDDLPLLEYAAPKALYAPAAEENDRLIRSFRRDEWLPVRGVDAATLASGTGRVRAARALFGWGFVPEAVEQLQRSAEAGGPGAREATLARGRLLLAMGYADDAAVELGALAREGRDAEASAWARAGDAMRVAGAGSVLQRALAESADDPTTLHHALGARLLYVAETTREPLVLALAGDELRTALRLAPGAPDLVRLLARAQSAVGAPPPPVTGTGATSR